MALWDHLQLLVRSTSKDTVEYILQALWRSRNTGLDPTDRAIICNMLHLQNDSDLDPLLVCLRMLIRRCVYSNITKEEMQNLFPTDVLPEICKLLTILLQKFQQEWRADVAKDQAALPSLKTMTWNMASSNEEPANPIAVINMKLKNDSKFHFGESEVKFKLGKDTLAKVLESLQSMREELSSVVDPLSVQLPEESPA